MMNGPSPICYPDAPHLLWGKARINVTSTLLILRPRRAAQDT